MYSPCARKLKYMNPRTSPLTSDDEYSLSRKQRYYPVFTEIHDKSYVYLITAGYK